MPPNRPTCVVPLARSLLSVSTLVTTLPPPVTPLGSSSASLPPSCIVSPWTHCRHSSFPLQILHIISYLQPLTHLSVTRSSAPSIETHNRLHSLQPHYSAYSALTCNMPCIYSFIILLLSLIRNDSILFRHKQPHQIKKGEKLINK